MDKMKQKLQTFIIEQLEVEPKDEKNLNAKAIIENYTSDLLNLLEEYRRSGLADKKLKREILTGDPKKIYSMIWEAQLFKLLQKQNHVLSATGDEGPDFFFEHEDKQIWIEATTLHSDKIKKEEDTFESGIIDTEKFTLKWKSAISGKSKRFQDYIQQNKFGVKTSDICIIAVSSLGMHKIRGAACFRPIPDSPTYSSHLEYGVGDPCVDAKGERVYRRRNNISKPNGALCASDLFSRDEYRHISAILSAHTPICTSEEHQYEFRMNPNANNPLSKDLYNKITNFFER